MIRLFLVLIFGQSYLGRGGIPPGGVTLIAITRHASWLLSPPGGPAA